MAKPYVMMDANKENPMRFSRIPAIALAVVLSVFLVSCQSFGGEVATQVVTVTAEEPAVADLPPAPPMEDAPVMETEEIVSEPVVISKSIYGYTVTVSVLDGKAVVEYPSVVTQDDAASFYAYEVEKYGSYIDGITYRLEDGSSTLSVPLADDAIVDNVPVFANDIMEYVSALLSK